MTGRLRAASFLDEAQECRGVARGLGGTRQAIFLLNIATAFEELHAAKQGRPQSNTFRAPGLNES